MNAADFAPRYVYPPAEVVRIIDGDTIEVELPLPLDIRYRATLRLIGYDAPEMHGPDPVGGRAATDYLELMISGAYVYVETYRERRTFTRYTARVWFDPGTGGDLVSVSDLMLASGLVVPWP